MYLRESRQRRASGEVVTYLQFAENVWNPATRRSETTIVYNFGRADDPAVRDRLRRLAQSILRRCSPEEAAAASPGCRVVDTWSYGDVYVLEALWARLGLDAILRTQAATTDLQFPVERALFAMVANRACAPGSKLYAYEQWLREDVRLAGTADLALHHLYRAMDFLEAHKTAVEEAIYFKVSDLLHLDVDLIFYDTTSLHFEIDDADTGDAAGEVHGSPAAGGKTYAAPRRRGHSKNGRGDAPQIVIGLAVSRAGIPVRHWIFPGNTVDVTTVAQVKKDLRGWKLGRCVFVGDAGMVSADNLRTLSLGGGHYIVCMPMRRGDEVTKQVLTRAGRYKVVAENLRVKVVTVGDGERRRRYVVCHNPAEATRQAAHRATVLAELEAELASLAACGTDVLTKRVCELRASGRYGSYLRLAGTRVESDRARVREEAHLDGKFVVHSNDDTLSAEDLALGYKQLMRVEEAWRTLKSGLRLRPVYHWAVHRVHAHVALTVLALLLERVAELACGDTWRNIRDDLRQIKLAHLKGPDGEVWQITEPRDAARDRLRQLKIPPPPALLKVE
jgi:hypothetical protein